MSVFSDFSRVLKKCVPFTIVSPPSKQETKALLQSYLDKDSSVTSLIPESLKTLARQEGTNESFFMVESLSISSEGKIKATISCVKELRKYLPTIRHLTKKKLESHPGIKEASVFEVPIRKKKRSVSRVI